MLLYGTQHTAPNSGPYVLYTTPLPIVKAKLPFSDRFAEHNRRMFSPIFTTRRFFEAMNTDYTLPITKNIMEVNFCCQWEITPLLIIDSENTFWKRETSLFFSKDSYDKPARNSTLFFVFLIRSRSFSIASEELEFEESESIMLIILRRSHTCLRVS